MQQADQQKIQPLCKITIEYNDSIRSIDLENFLTGIRMICQHGLAEKVGGKPRDYTDVTKIQSIEKGSIVLNMLFDFVHLNIEPIININANLLSCDVDLLDIILFYLGRKEIKGNLKVHYNNLMSALRHFKCIKLEDLKHKIRIYFDGDEIKCIDENDIQRQ